MKAATGDASRPPDPDSLPDGAPADSVALAAYRLTSLAGALLAAWVCWRALGLTYYTPIGPGPGFFPFWLGLILGVFSLAVLTKSFRHRPLSVAERFVPGRSPLVRIVATVAAIGAFALFVERLGFAITMFFVLGALLLVHGCRLVPTGLLVALAGSFGVAYAFAHWLGVYIPPAPLGLLRAIGL